MIVGSIVGRDLHLGDVTNVLIRICHDEFKAQTIESVEEVKLTAVKFSVALELELEGDIFGTRSLLENHIALSGTTFNGCKPLAL